VENCCALNGIAFRRCPSLIAQRKPAPLPEVQSMVNESEDVFLPVRSVLLIAVLVAAATASFSQDVLTYHNSISRNGLNNKETMLTLSNVNSASFGKLFTLPADGLVDAQPFYLSAVSVGGVTHNLLIVATEHDTVYAYDADTGASIWQITTLKSGETTSDNRGCGQKTSSKAPPIHVLYTEKYLTLEITRARILS
jgi:hypothetical protein